MKKTTPSQGKTHKESVRQIIRLPQDEAYHELLQLPVEYAATVMDRLLLFDASLVDYMVERLKADIRSYNPLALDIYANYLIICVGLLLDSVVDSFDTELRNLLRYRINEILERAQLPNHK